MREDRRPCVARAALDAGLRDASQVERAVAAQAAAPGRSLEDLLELDDAARARLRERRAQEKPAIERQAEELAFERWALATGRLTPAALERARVLVAGAPGARIWEALLASNLELELTPTAGRTAVSCPTCCLSVELPAPVAPYSDACAWCGAQLGAEQTPPGTSLRKVDDPIEAQHLLSDEAFARWAAAEAHVPEAELVAARAEAGGMALSEALVARGAVDLETVMELLEAEADVTCRACEARLRLPPRLVRHAPGCPRCGKGPLALAGEAGPSRLPPAPEATVRMAAGAHAAAESTVQMRADRAGGAPPGARLLDAAFQRWAAKRGIASAALEEAGRDAPTGSLAEALVARGALDLEQAMEATSDPVDVRCAGCHARFELPLALAQDVGEVPCPTCDAYRLVRPQAGDAATAGTVIAHVEASASEGTVKFTGTAPQATHVVRKIGAYDVVRLLGRGGMGEVFLARSGGGEQVALKVLSGQLQDQGSRERFVREGRILERVSHENLVRAIDHGIDPTSGRPFLALEFVDGRDVDSIMGSRPSGKLTVEEAVRVLHGCALGLAAVHKAGVIHRDVKPSNVLATRDGKVKLTDFGIALTGDVSVRLTAQGEIMGTPQYVAPEIVLGEEWTPAADLYALGSFAHRVLTGKVLFERPNVLEVLEAHAGAAPPSLAEAAPEVPGRVRELVARLLSKSPKDRPTAAEAADVLAPLLPSADKVTGLFTAAPTTGASGTRPAGGGKEQTLAEGQVFHHYRLQKEIGRGGMGVVYKAMHLGLKKTVALKVMLSGALASDDERRRFLREAESAGALQHTNIVPVLDAGEHQGTYFLTMEYVEGRPMSKLIKEGGKDGKPLEAEAMLRVFARVCEGVFHAHSRGVIHRDLKPDNVLVDEQLEPHILDFGIAKKLDAGDDQAALTTEGDIMGTLRYMPPEQASGTVKDIDVRSDVYALGSILYEVVTHGQTPFQGSVREILHQIHFVEPRPPSMNAAGVEVPWELDAICLKALEKNRDDRYQSAVELKRDVERFLDGLPIAAKRATLVYRARKWVTRNKRKAAAVATATLAAGSVVGMLVYERVAREQARQAAIVDAAASGWRSVAEARFADAITDFGKAQATITPDDVLVLPGPAVAVLPPDVVAKIAEGERTRPRVTGDRLTEWTAYAQRRIEGARVAAYVREGRAAFAEGRLDAAGESFASAKALDREDAGVRALGADLAAAFVALGQRHLATGHALRAEQLSAFDRRGAALASARAAFEQARGHDVAAAGIAEGLAEVGVELAQLEQDRAQAARIAQAAAKLAEATAALEEAGRLSAAGQDDAARTQLLDARWALTAALQASPDLEAAQEAMTRVALALAEVALRQEKLELAEEELRYARLYGRLASEVERVQTALNGMDRSARAFREHKARGDRFYADGAYAQARGAYELALAQRADADVARRLELCRALVEADGARGRGDLLAERAALLRARGLHEDPRTLDAPLGRLDAELHDRALAEADRALREAQARGHGSQGSGVWQEVARAYERALAYRPDSALALRMRADAYAELSRPDDMLLVTVPARLVARGAAAARVAEDECLRFYVDRTEVTNAHFQAFVAAGGYAREDLWSAEGWAARAAFVDGTGRPGPAGWVDAGPPPGTERLPVSGVSYHEAQAYAAWARATALEAGGEGTAALRRLPTEEEWALAACFDLRLGRARRFPWEEALPQEQVASLRSVRDVGAAALDRSPWEVRDMGFNVSEWVQSGGAGVVRGLSFRSFAHDVATGVLDWRKTPWPTYRDRSVGFRCAADVPPPPPPPAPEESR